MSDRWVDRLRAAGRSTASGEFTLDRERAREKLQKFQLRDPHEYILQFVEVGHLLGATWMEVAIDADEAEVRFDGAPLERGDLESIYAAAFQRGRERRTEALRHLAIGLLAAHEVDPAIIRVESSGDGPSKGVALVVESTDEQRVEAASGPERGTTRIYLRETLRAAHVPQFFHNLGNDLAEQELVRSRCRFAPIALRLDGERIDERRPLAESVGRLEFETRYETGVVGLREPDALEVSVRSSAGRAVLVQNGVVVSNCRFGEGLAPAHPRAVVRTRRLHKNLSQSAFVEDDSWRTLTGRVLPSLALDAAIEFVAGLSRKDQRRYHDWLRRLFWSIHADLQGGSGDRRHRLLELLGELPLLASAVPLPGEEGVVEIEGIPHLTPARVARGDGAVRWTRRRFPYSPDEGGGPVVWARSGGARRAFEAATESTDALFGRAVEVTDELRRDQQRRANRLRWQEQSEYDVPVDGVPRFESTAEEAGLRCELHLRPSDAGHALHVVKEERLLESVDLSELPLPGGVSVVAGSIEPDARWAGAARNARFRRALFRLLEMLPETLAEAARHYRDVRKSVPGWLRDALLSMLERELVGAYLTAVGARTPKPRRAFRKWYEREVERPLEESPWALGELKVEGASASSRLEELTSKLGSLAEVPLFRALPAGTPSIEELGRLDERQGRIPYIVDESDGKWWRDEGRAPGFAEAIRGYERGTWDETLVVVDPSEKGLLERLLGAAVENVDDEFARRANEAAFVRRRRPVAFEESTYADVRRLERDSWSARLGLRPVGPEWVDAQNPPDEFGGLLRLECTYRKRRVARRRVSFPVGRMRAVVESRRWRIRPDFSGVEEDDFFGRVVAEVRSAARDLLVEYCRDRAEAYVGGEGTGLIVVWRAIAATRERDAYRELRELPAFEIVGEGVVSYDELRGRLGSRRRAAFVVGSAEDVEASSAAGSLEVVVAPGAGEARRLLGELFAVETWEDVSETPSGEGLRKFVKEGSAGPVERSVEPAESGVDASGPRRDGSDTAVGRVERALREELRALSSAAGPALELRARQEVAIAPTYEEWVERGPEGALRIDPEHEAVRYAVATARRGGEPDPIAIAVLVSSYFTAVSDRFGGRNEIEEFSFHSSHAARVADLLGSDSTPSEES